MKTILLIIALIALIAGTVMLLRNTGTIAGPGTGLVKVAESGYQWTGVAATKEGRLFVNYPTWRVPSPHKVVELINGAEVPYPSAEDNDRFICVQSVVVDDLNRLWILDAANPGFQGVVPEGPSLYLVDTQTDDIVQTYKFSPEVYSNRSYLNDVRIDTKSWMAYMTDSAVGGIVVLNLESKESWRALDNSCPAVTANLDGVVFRSTGKSAGITHSDGIELSADGRTLYFTALTGDILYQVDTSVLLNRDLDSAGRCEQVQVLNAENVPTDGMILYNNKLYMANLPDESLWVVDLATGTGTALDFGTPIRWADSFAKDGEGYLYFTTSQINYPPQDRIKYELFKFRP